MVYNPTEHLSNSNTLPPTQRLKGNYTVTYIRVVELYTVWLPELVNFVSFTIAKLDYIFS